MLGYAKISSQTSRVGSGVQGESSMKQVLKSIKRFESHSVQQNIIYQHCYPSYCNYLLKMVHMDEDQAVFEQLSLSDFKKRSSTALKTFNNYTIIMTKNSDKIRIL